MLLHHVDVVPAEASRWSHGPFSGDATPDGRIWGRGALDMKGFGILQLVAFLELKRRGVPLRRDVILAATADEEAGADTGVAWLLAHHPDAFRAGEVLNEGGMGLITKSGKPLMGIQTAERGTFWVRATAQGATGHGSRERPDSATRRLLRALAKLETAPRRLELGPESQAMLHAFASTEGPIAAFALRAAAQPWILPLLGPRLVATEPALAPLLDNTINPTVLVAGGGNTNVIPGEASAEIDLRLLPGRTGAGTLDWLKATMAVPGDPPIAFKVLHERAYSRSVPKGSLWDGLQAGIAAEYPDVPIMPILTPGGGTDSSFFRDRGVQALGCMPILATQPQIDAMHGDDEHITREQLARGTRAMVRVLEHAAAVR
jgi:acetylornithine deacetylase/succinyl-diaminopimelate desuccinylase-like protein